VRNWSMISVAGQTRPALTDSQERASAACSAARSVSVKSSPSSSGHKIDDRAVGERCRLIQNQSAVFDAGAQARHGFTPRPDRHENQCAQLGTRSP
jgi:hypothetical protein